MAARLPMRLLARHVRCARRNFSTSNSMLEAQNFMMPAMSPTMTEGNISSWKVKEGDSFSAGDILLEIETDKASMDVEAQDDGVVAKIFQGDGTKAVKVGTRIAVLGEAGDDVSSLKIPEDTSSPVQSEKDKSAPAKEESKEKQQSLESTPENQKPSQPRSKPSPTGPGQNPKYPLYPAVQILIHQNHISDEDVKKIPATGPQGRLLKGDVLAYLGTIEADYSKKQSERIEKNGHLDLSNIKILERQPPKSSSQTTALSEQPRQTTVSILISLAEVLKTQARIRDTLNVTMPLSTFLARAVDYANDDLPRPKGSSASQDELFNAVLGLDTIATTSRGTYLPQIDALPAPTSRFGSSPTTTSSSRSSKPDILDILSGHARPIRSATARSISTTSTSTSSSSIGHSTARGAINTFTLTVPVSEERRARVFLERMKTILQVEPGRLVL